MKYIPGKVFVVKKPKLSGKVKELFIPGRTYQIHNIQLKEDNKVLYTFMGGGAGRFEMLFDSKQIAENTIDYLLNLI